MKNKIIDFFRLIRIPNGFTAIADSMAGYFIAGGHFLSDTQPLNYYFIFLLAVISFSLYSFGIIINDIHDIEIDRIKRPDRPLPSKKIKISQAYILSGFFIAVSCGSGFVLGKTVFLFVLILIFTILSYDIWLKTNPVIAPLCMGLCRFLNFLTGTSLFFNKADLSKITVLGFSLFVYVTLLTFASRYENNIKIRIRLFISIFLWVIFIYAAGCLSSIFTENAGYLFILCFTVYLFWIFLKYVKPQKIDLFRTSIKFLVIGIVFFDATITAGTQELLYGLVILAILLPAIMLAKKIPVN